MPLSAFRLKSTVTAVIRDSNGYRLRELPPGSVFFATGSKPDPNGMIDGTCNGDVVLLFRRDLTERSEEINPKIEPEAASNIQHPRDLSSKPKIQ